MKKKDVLKELKAVEMAEALKVQPSTITRMSENVPEHHIPVLRRYIKRKITKLRGQLKRLEEMVKNLEQSK